MNRAVFSRLLVMFAGFGLATDLRADVQTPPGLSPGDKFHVVFVTSELLDSWFEQHHVYDLLATRNALNGGLGTYDGSPVTWYAVGSTSTLSAIERVPLTSPALFLPDGTLVAVSGADFWDGTLVHPINKTQHLETVHDVVFTGTNPDGTRSEFELGDVETSVTYGNTQWSDSRWIAEDVNHDMFMGPSSFRFYAVSEVLTVPVNVPEPSSIALVSALLAGIGIWRTRAVRCPHRRR